MDDHDDEDDHGSQADHDDHGEQKESEERTTAPMQEFSTGQVGVGFVVLVVGLVLTFGLAFGFVGI